ncbi:porin family protein [Afipia massiliensis]|uniref:Porin family protein n=1 Tax=Afipia massiliensis TaxID=211460 RepID=A0A4U6BS09_9BRAD|nr:outer membrane beta-barrel protein [Afipia massiliensis]TKT73390.1 porin family protein [Afipia massiliensis]
MKMIALAATLVATLSATAHAADLYRKAPVAPIASWTGFYAGVNIGGGWSNTNVGYGTSDPVTAIFFGAGVDLPANGDRVGSSGVLGGAQIGYNYQFQPAWVAGVEADFQFADISGSGATPYIGGALVSSASQDIQYFGTVRARLGYLATDRLMVYATGGFAYAQLNNAATLDIAPGGTINLIGIGTSTNCGGAFPNSCFAGSSSSLTPGWTAGGGLEYALGQNWSLKGEYLYARFEQTITASAVTPTPGTLPNTYIAKFATELNIARVGLNYRF